MDRIQDQGALSLSNGATRARAHRLRRKRGVRLVRIAVNETELGLLVELGYLEPELRKEVAAIQTAANLYFGDRLFDEAN